MTTDRIRGGGPAEAAIATGPFGARYGAIVTGPVDPREVLAETARQLGSPWTPLSVEAALAKLNQDGIELDPAVEEAATLTAVIQAADMELPDDAPAEVLLLDQEAINRAQPQSAGEGPAAPRGVAAIARELQHGPVTMTGPERHWCIQAIANIPAGHVQIEILDPVHWGRGPALPPDQLEVAADLGFKEGEGMWILKMPLDQDRALEPAALLIETFIERAWR